MSILKLKLILYVLLIIAGISFAGPADAEKSLIFSVHPYLPATELVKRYTPLTNYLSQKLDSLL